MINYINAENSRFVKSKTFRITTLVILLLIIAGTYAVYFTGGDLPLNSSSVPAHMYFRLTIGMGMFMIFINIIYLSILTTKDLNTIPLALHNGVSRKEIYFSKFIVMLFYILITEFIFVGIIVACSRFVFKSHDIDLLNSFILSYVNLIPMIISSTALTYALMVNKVKELYSTGAVFLLYGFPIKLLLTIISLKFPAVLELVPYTPAYVVDHIPSLFELGTVVFYPESFIIGLVITVLSLGIGYNIFVKRDF